MMKPASYPIVRPVMELAVRAFRLSESEQGLANLIEQEVDEQDYISTPDGWFVPLMQLRNHLETVSELLLHETLHYGEFEVGGGFEILIASHSSLGVPIDSNFRFAMDLAHAVINLEKGMIRQIAVGSRENWIISRDSIEGKFLTVVGKPSGIVAQLPYGTLREALEEAQIKLASFATDLENRLIQYKNPKITSAQIRFMFGIDKLPKML